MKKSLFILSIFIFSVNVAFSQEKVTNIPKFDDKSWHWGYYLGANYYSFNVLPTRLGMITTDNNTQKDRMGIQVQSTPGLTVGLISDFRLNEYFNLRFEPGLNYATRKLIYDNEIISNSGDSNGLERSISSTYIDLTLLVKFGGKRSKNIKPYVIGGAKLSIDLNSKEDNSEDNTNGVFKMKTITASYDLGAGIDWYLPYFKFSTELRGSFGVMNEMVEDQTIYTTSIEKLRTRAIFFVLKFE